uniref:Excinuclease ABC subunit C n=1 Tax=Thermodesulfobacterium geofontis TaxID=1295609 RepID=A0A7C4P0J6_9BACT
MREILKLLSKTFPLRKCSLAEMKRRKTPCIYYQIKKCLAPCVNPVPEEEYKKMVDGVIEFFSRKGKGTYKKT